MLEEIAVQYVNTGEDDLRLIGYGIVIAGGVLAGLVHKSQDELARATYFAYSAILFFGRSAAEIIWLGSIPAMTGGYLWIFMLVDVFVALAVGYGLGVIAMARSRDAYGHGKLAFLAFIPFANLWLLFTQSRLSLSPKREPTIPLLTGDAGVATGFVFLFAGIVLTAFLRLQLERMVQVAQSDPTMQEAGVDFMIRAHGLDATLREMALGFPTPSPIDDVTTLTQVEGDGTTLRYTYEVMAVIDTLPMSVRTGLTRQNCTYAAMRPVIEAGATLEHVYLRPDGSEIGVVKVNQDICRLNNE